MNAELVAIFRSTILLEAEIRFARETNPTLDEIRCLGELQNALKAAEWPLRNAVQATLPVEMKFKP